MCALQNGIREPDSCPSPILEDFKELGNPVDITRKLIPG
jgi:hypothetical protein